MDCHKETFSFFSCVVCNQSSILNNNNGVFHNIMIHLGLGSLLILMGYWSEMCKLSCIRLDGIGQIIEQLVQHDSTTLTKSSESHR